MSRRVLLIALFQLATMPDSLQKAIANRQTIQTAQIWWSQVTGYGITRHRSLIAGKDSAYNYLGDGNGKTGAVNKDGIIVDLFHPTSTMRKGDDHWSNAFGYQSRVGDKQPFHHVDYRDVGLVPSRRVKSFVEFVKTVTKWDETDGVVIGTTDKGTTKWFIDENYNVTRVENEHGATDIEYDGFLPTGVTYTHKGQFSSHIQVDEAIINDPSLPSELVPEFIGITTGMPVIELRGDKIRQLIWGNGRLWGNFEMTEEDVETWVYGEKRVAVNNQQPIPLHEFKDVRDVVRSLAADPWDVYVARFIVKHTLDLTQRRAASRYLYAMKKRRDRHIKAKRTELVEKTFDDLKARLEKLVK